jgi:uncharacterized protein (DUF305 family)
VRRALVIVASLCAFASLYGCGAQAPNQPVGRQPVLALPPEQHRPAEAFNAQDVVFLQEMIPHHEQALRMVEIALTRVVSPEARGIAEKVERVTPGEIRMMAGWLASLGIDAPSSADAGHSHGGGMTAQDVEDLASLSGPQFDARFLGLMTQHGLGAIEIATVETRDGENTAVRQLAAMIASRESDQGLALRRLH